MRNIPLASLLCFLTIVSINFANVHTDCPSVRSQACKRNLNMVCAYGEGHKEIGTKANKCAACSKPEVMNTVDGPCHLPTLRVLDQQEPPVKISVEADQSTGNLSKATVCPETRGKFCTMQFQPVCGYDKDANIVDSFSNECIACSNRVVEKTINGDCPATPILESQSAQSTASIIVPSNTTQSTVNKIEKGNDASMIKFIGIGLFINMVL